MRIIAGTHRGRPLKAPDGADVRPTADRTREALFNLLEHGRLAAGGSRVVDARVLDGFCGTGAVALEALSRGAAFATGIDASPDALATARANARTLGEEDRMAFFNADVTRPPMAEATCDLIVLDPPYGQDLAPAAIAALDAAGWISAGALIVVETGAKERLELPPGFQALDRRRYGRAAITFVERG